MSDNEQTDPQCKPQRNVRYSPCPDGGYVIEVDGVMIGDIVDEANVRAILHWFRSALPAILRGDLDQSKPRDVSQIVEQYLTSHGYDGLYDADGECSCETGDLGPCDSGIRSTCKPGYRYIMSIDDCEWHGLGRPGDWGMRGTK